MSSDLGKRKTLDDERKQFRNANGNKRMGTNFLKRYRVKINYSRKKVKFTLQWVKGVVLIEGICEVW